jgi:Zn-dependent oligopeptidase
MEHAFDPTMDFVGLYSNWGKAKTRARKRLAMLQQYVDDPDLEFLHLLDDLVGFIRNQSTAAGFFSQYHPEEEMRAAGEYVRAAALRLSVEVTSSSDIASLLKRVDAHGLDNESRRYLKFAQREARRSGGYLGESEREQYKVVCDKLEHLKMGFVMIEEDPYLWVHPGLLSSMSTNYRQRHKVDPATGRVMISVKSSDYLTFVEYCDDDAIVKRLYELRENMMPENEQMLKSILELRGEQAKLLGYSSYADYAMEVGMMSSPQAVRKFLVEANDRARTNSEREMRELSAVMKAKDRKLEEWNLPYATRQLLQCRFANFDPETAHGYFPLSNILPGALKLLAMLFRLEFREVHNIPMWHPSVRTFEVFNTRPVNVRGSRDAVDYSTCAPRLCGRLYLDLLSRESKASNPCAIDLTSSTRYSPIVPAICLAASFGYSQDTCITFTAVSNLLHELGHCMHFLLAQTSAYHRFNGFANELDFMEVPSLLLEELLRLPEVVRMLAVDLEGNCIPEEYVGTLIATRDVNRAMSVRTQTLYSLISVRLGNFNITETNGNPCPSARSPH